MRFWIAAILGTYSCLTLVATTASVVGESKRDTGSASTQASTSYSTHGNSSEGNFSNVVLYPVPRTYPLIVLQIEQIRDYRDPGIELQVFIQAISFFAETNLNTVVRTNLGFPFVGYKLSIQNPTRSNAFTHRHAIRATRGFSEWMSYHRTFPRANALVTVGGLPAGNLVFEHEDYAGSGEGEVEEP